MIKLISRRNSMILISRYKNMKKILSIDCVESLYNLLTELIIHHKNVGGVRNESYGCRVRFHGQEKNQALI